MHGNKDIKELNKGDPLVLLNISVYVHYNDKIFICYVYRYTRVALQNLEIPWTVAQFCHVKYIITPIFMKIACYKLITVEWHNCCAVVI